MKTSKQASKPNHTAESEMCAPINWEVNGWLVSLLSHLKSTKQELYLKLLVLRELEVDSGVADFHGRL